MTFYAHEIETFREGEIVELTDYMKKCTGFKENYILKDDKFLIEGVDTNSFIRVQNIRNNKKFLCRDTSLQHIVPEVKACLL